MSVEAPVTVQHSNPNRSAAVPCRRDEEGVAEQIFSIGESEPLSPLIAPKKPEDSRRRDIAGVPVSDSHPPSDRLQFLPGIPLHCEPVQVPAADPSPVQADPQAGVVSPEVLIQNFSVGAELAE
jgi:hypothetical protein